MQLYVTRGKKGVIFSRKVLLYTVFIYPVLGGILQPATGSFALHFGLVIMFLHIISIIIFLNMNRFVVTGKIHFLDNFIQIKDKKYRISDIISMTIIYEGYKNRLSNIQIYGLRLITKDGGGNTLYLNTKTDGAQRFTFLFQNKNQFHQLKEKLKAYRCKGIQVKIRNLLW